MALTESQQPNLGIEFQAVIDATGTGTAFSQYFSIPIRGQTYFDTIMVWYKNGGNGNLAAFQLDLEVSFDGGTTFNKMSSIDLIALGAQPIAIQGGGVYRFNITTFTVGALVPKGEVYIMIG